MLFIEFKFLTSDSFPIHFVLPVAVEGYILFISEHPMLSLTVIENREMFRKFKYKFGIFYVAVTATND